MLGKTSLAELFSGKKIKILVISIVLLKVSLDYKYYSWLSTLEINVYTRDFNLIKYLNGIIWLIIIFVAINHKQRNVSTFLITLVYIMQIIPITTIYAFGNKEALCYNGIWFSFFLRILVVNNIDFGVKKKLLEPNLKYSRFIEILMMLMCFLIFAYIVKKNGLPTLTALNIYNVYDLRASGAFSLGKYPGYVLSWVTNVIIPFFATKYILEKNFEKASIFIAMIFVIYLYDGHKTNLFISIVVVIVAFWIKRKDSYIEMISCLCFGISVLVALSSVNIPGNNIFLEIFSLFGRRVMLLSAQNKFAYFDYFSKSPKMGLGGLFPTWFLHFDARYVDIDYTRAISGIYYGTPEAVSNTGYFAECHARFGVVGYIAEGILLATILKLLDVAQKNIGYELLLGTSMCVFLGLNDAFLLNSIVLGPMMFLIFISLFYKSKCSEDKPLRGHNDACSNLCLK